MTKLILITLFALGTLLHPEAQAGSHEGAWISRPRSALTIVIGKESGLIAGPGWEHSFDAYAETLDFEVGPGQRFVLRRNASGWAGEYYHPPILPGAHTSEAHKMAFICRDRDCS